MSKQIILTVLAGSSLLSLAGCTSSPKTSKSSSVATTSPFMSSAKKVQQDFNQTETDLSQLESQAKIPR